MMNMTNEKPTPKQTDEPANSIDISSYFQMPISYGYSKPIQPIVSTDLELKPREIIHTCENDEDVSTKCVYDTFLSNDNKDTEPTQELQLTIHQLHREFTTDISFLQDTQTLLKHYKTDTSNNNSFLSNWQSFKQQDGFIEKYKYIEFEHLRRFNENSTILQVMTIYNLASPVISLVLPILFMIIPFILIKFFMRVPITFDVYKNVLMDQLKNHNIGKTLLNITSGEYDKKITGYLMILFYLFTIYQNIILCIKYYSNIYTIYAELYNVRCYLDTTLKSIECLEGYTKFLSTFSPFNQVLTERKQQIQHILDNDFQTITSSKFTIRLFHNVGHYMRVYYSLYNDDTYHSLLMYCCGFHGYIQLIEQLQKKLECQDIHFCKFVSNDEHREKSLCKIKQQYYGFLNKSNAVKNDVSFKKNFIITGPNASGKTTFLKTTMINLILSQQFGVGYYEDATIQPYDDFFSYVNIPDTSGRDSLFQAEARQCLEFLQLIQKNTNTDTSIKSKSKHYFCIFDELFSGTNPTEAVISAKTYIQYLIEHNVDFMLTTHYKELCSLPKKHSNVENYHFLTKVIDTTREKCDEETNICMRNPPRTQVFDYTYKLEKGISNIQGGIQVLYDLQFPNEFIELLQKNITNERTKTKKTKKSKKEIERNGEK